MRRSDGQGKGWYRMAKGSNKGGFQLRIKKTIVLRGNGQKMRSREASVPIYECMRVERRVSNQFMETPLLPPPLLPYLLPSLL